MPMCLCIMSSLCVFRLGSTTSFGGPGIDLLILERFRAQFGAYFHQKVLILEPHYDHFRRIGTLNVDLNSSPFGWCAVIYVLHGQRRLDTG